MWVIKAPSLKFSLEVKDSSQPHLSPFWPSDPHCLCACSPVASLLCSPPPHSAQDSFSLQGSASGQGFLPALLASPLMSTGLLTEVSFIIVILFFLKLIHLLRTVLGLHFRSGALRCFEGTFSSCGAWAFLLWLLLLWSRALG